MSDAKLTPMMQQYFEVKRGLPRDTLLLFRLGATVLPQSA